MTAAAARGDDGGELWHPPPFVLLLLRVVLPALVGACVGFRVRGNGMWARVGGFVCALRRVCFACARALRCLCVSRGPAAAAASQPATGQRVVVALAAGLPARLPHLPACLPPPPGAVVDVEGARTWGPWWSPPGGMDATRRRGRVR